MTPLRLIAATCAAALASLICITTLPLAGPETTIGLWLMTIGIAAGLVAIVAAVLAIASMTPVNDTTARIQADRAHLAAWRDTDDYRTTVDRVLITRAAIEAPSYELEAGQ